jgi:hypothetical protein
MRRLHVIASGNRWHPEFGSNTPRLKLIAQRFNGRGRWANKLQPVLDAQSLKIGTLREKAVARMDGVATRALSGSDYSCHVQITAGRGCRSDAYGTVRHRRSQRFAIGC